MKVGDGEKADQHGQGRILQGLLCSGRKVQVGFPIHAVMQTCRRQIVMIAVICPPKKTLSGCLGKLCPADTCCSSSNQMKGASWCPEHSVSEWHWQGHTMTFGNTKTNTSKAHAKVLQNLVGHRPWGLVEGRRTASTLRRQRSTRRATRMRLRLAGQATSKATPLLAICSSATTDSRRLAACASRASPTFLCTPSRSSLLALLYQGCCSMCPTSSFLPFKAISGQSKQQMELSVAGDHIQPRSRTC